MSGPDYSVPVLLNLIQVNLVSFYLPALDYLSGVVTARIIKKGIFFSPHKAAGTFATRKLELCKMLQITDYWYLVPHIRHQAELVWLWSSIISC